VIRREVKSCSIASSVIASLSDTVRHYVLEA
jgi:hypothetical protein